MKSDGFKLKRTQILGIIDPIDHYFETNPHVFLFPFQYFSSIIRNNVSHFFTSPFILHLSLALYPLLSCSLLSSQCCGEKKLLITDSVLLDSEEDPYTSVPTVVYKTKI